MARPDPLEQDSLNPGRFGHCPALWLALPLLLGCAVDQAWHPAPGPMLLIGTCALVLGFWQLNREPIGAAALGLANWLWQPGTD